MYCIIKCIVQGKQARVKNRRFTSSVLHSRNVKMQICVTRSQCVKYDYPEFLLPSLSLIYSFILLDKGRPIIRSHCVE